MRKLTIFIGVICALGAIVVQLPAGWAAKFASVEISEDAKFHGTIWSGRVSGMNGLGPVDYKLSPKNLFSEAPLISFKSQMPGFLATGHARSGIVTDVDVQGHISTFSNVEPRLAGLRGGFAFGLERLVYNDTCIEASGQASTDVLQANSAQWQWSGPQLSGPAACENGELVVRLSGQDGGQIFSIVLRCNLSGVYTANFTITTTDPQAAMVLPLYGFEKRGNSYALQETGTWY